MINILFDLGLTEREIKDILNIDKQVDLYDSCNFLKVLSLLGSIGFNNTDVKQIVIANSMILNRDYEDIVSLIKNLKEYGFSDIKELFAMNPWFINKDGWEIKEFYQKLIHENNKKDITELLESNPYMIDEY